MAVTHTTHARYTSQQMNRMGFYLFILSESMLFLGLVASRFYLQGTYIPEQANRLMAVGLTIILLLSSVAAYRAELAARAGNRSGVIQGFAVTILLGTVFLIGVGFEWAEAFESFPPASGYGTIFFAITGMHAFHLVTGMGFIALVVLNVRRGDVEDNHWPVEAAVRYWHFVDAAWLLLFFPTLYLI